MTNDSLMCLLTVFPSRSYFIAGCKLLFCLILPSGTGKNIVHEKTSLTIGQWLLNVLLEVTQIASKVNHPYLLSHRGNGKLLCRSKALCFTDIYNCGRFETQQFKYNVAVVVVYCCGKIFHRPGSYFKSCNRPFYSRLLGDLAFEWQRGWRWPCFDTDLTAFITLR